MAQVTRTSGIQAAFAAGGLGAVFVDELGWEAPRGVNNPVLLEEGTYSPVLVSSLKGFHVYAIPTADRPTRHLMKRVDMALAQLAPERMEVFQGPGEWFWYWPRRTSAGTTTFEAIETAPNVIPTFLAQRLAGLRFTVADHRANLSLTSVRDRVHGHFDATNVTKRFYDRFASEHEKLAVAIDGAPHWASTTYSTTLLNRMMFLYFMQKKEFLNGDPWYLEHTLKAVQDLKGRDNYYSFYREALLPLFFERLNDRSGTVSDPRIAEILGEVPYINGGIFGPTSIEDEFGGQISVPDSAFERILGFFAEYNWHLDTRPTGNENEINPDVLGYIFEQFVNSKQMGAYYTKEDVTHFMTRSALMPVIVSQLEALRIPVWDLLPKDPDRYLWPSLEHGTEHALPATIEVERISHRRPSWLGRAPEDIGLPGESWWEVDGRRASLDAARTQLAAGGVDSVDSAVSVNVNIEALAVDAIRRLDDTDDLLAVWKAITDLRVIDPTCGSGAFLFAALNLLVPIYSAVVDAIDSSTSDSHPGLAALRAEIDGHKGGAEYFLLKHACLSNLYGVDLMPEAVEVARLRLFLKLASAIDAPNKLEPLPDLDFNIKAGNVLVGALTPDEIKPAEGDLFSWQTADVVVEAARGVGAAYTQFRAAQEADDAEAVKERRASLKGLLVKVRDDVNRQYYAAQKREQTYHQWVGASRPFHWFLEFPEVFDRGGFDVVIGNPPYIARGKVTEYSFEGFRTDLLPDIYAPCTERASQITGPNGRMALIVPISASFSDDFRKLREMLEHRFGRLWVSNFSRNPAALFSSGLGVRSTILVGHRGTGDHQMFVTKTHRWYDAFRPALFDTLQYFELPSDLSRKHGWVRLPSAAFGKIVKTVNQTPGSLAALERPRSGVASVGYKQTALYWLAVFLTDPPAYERDGRVVAQTKVGRIFTENETSALLLLAVAASKFAFVWWYATGDDFDVTGAGLKSTPIDPSQLSHSAQGKLVSAARRLVSDFDNHLLFTPYAGKFMGTYILSEMRHITDEIDEVLASELGYAELLPALEHAYACVYKPTGDRPGTLREDPFGGTRATR